MSVDKPPPHIYDRRSRRIYVRVKGGGRLGLFRLLAIGLFIVAVPVALITTNIRVAVSEQSVYDYSVQNYGASQASNIPQSELLRANGVINHYLTRGDSGPLSIAVQDNTGRVISLFNARETAHMADVRDLLQAMFIVQVGSLALLLTLAVVMLYLWAPRAVAAAALCGSLLTGVVLGLAGVLALTGFDSAWSQFHGIAFSNDLWKLDPSTDHLIQMFPEAFWQKITTVIGGATLMEALVVATLSIAYLVLRRPQAAEEPVKPVPVLSAPPVRPRPRLSPPDPRHLSS